MSYALDDAIRTYAEGLSVDELIGQVKAFIGVFEAVNGPVAVPDDGSEHAAVADDELTDVELIGEVKRALTDIGAL